MQSTQGVATAARNGHLARKLLLCAFLFGAATQAAFAAQLIGGVCVPDSAAIKQGLYETAGFGVRFPGSNLGSVRLLCQFEPAIDFGWTLSAMKMSYIDSDGMGTGGRVRATLRRARMGTNVAESLGTCDSDTSDERGPTALFCELKTTVKVEGEYWYWWEVILDRSSEKVNVEFLGIESMYSLD